MKKNILLLPLLSAALVLIAFASCGGDDDIGGSTGTNPENEKMVGTKWISTNWDYGAGDDWVSTLDETITFYFYSNSEGLLYYGRNDWSSDTGSSSDRAVSHFTYDVSGNNIKLDYITDPVTSIYSLTLKGNTISANGIDYAKDTFTAADTEWLATLHGVTGECKWYHNLVGTLWIAGEGDMADYTSYAVTPWGRQDGHGVNCVVVKDGVTSIGSAAFASPSIGEVDMPHSAMRKIGAYAFSDASISEIYLSDDITEIQEGSFTGCSYLKKVTLPENIETIGDYAFDDCKEASLANTKKLRKIGKFAFAGCKIKYFTDSEVLEEVGTSAFTNIYVDKLILPNSLKTLGHIAFKGDIDQIYIGTGLKNVTGTPFYMGKTGKIYVNLGSPLQLDYDFLDPASGWTLYVPKGCKEAYSSAPYWKNFKSIVEDETLEPGGGVPDEGGEGEEDDEDGEDDVNVEIPQTYTNGGMEYKFVKVESTTMPTFYIMQTELNVHSNLRIGGNADIGMLDSNGDNAVIKAEFRNFLEKIKEETGIQMRLPTREEWMYAASGGNKSKGYAYSGSDDIDEVAWYEGNSQDYVHFFALKKPNELGLYDMSGNYGEVCNDKINDVAYVDGVICGGCFSDDASSCKITSYKPGSTSTDVIPGLGNIREYNAFDARVITVRLVFTEP